MAGPTALMELLAPTRIPSAVSMTHVVEVRDAAEAFRGWDARYGGGLMCEATVAQLRHCAELLNAHCSETVRRELLTAVGSFAEMAGYMAEDDYAHDDARRMYRFALACAEEAGTGTCASRCCARWPFKPHGAATQTPVSPTPSLR